MPYSLISAATLGFDVVRLPAGGRLAEVLLAGLTAGPDTMHRLAAAHPCAGLEATERAGLAIRSRRARELAAAGAPHLRGGISGIDGSVLTETGSASGSGAVSGAGAVDSSTRRTALLLAQLERATIGNAQSLERLVRDDVLGPEHPAAGVDGDVWARAADVLADAAVGYWAAAALPAAARLELVTAFHSAGVSAVAGFEQFGPAGDGLAVLLDAVGGLDAAGRNRWRSAVDQARAQQRPWASAMHSACWAAHVSGRTRALATAQLLAVQAFFAGGFEGSDGARGVWNALAGCVQGVFMADLIEEDSLAALLAPWSAATGRALPLPS